MNLRILFACMLLLGVGPAFAHHAFTMFDQTREITLEGTVVEFQWKNPHCFIVLNVPTTEGGDETWAIEGGAPSVLTGLGWRPGSMKPGDKVTVVTHPLRSGEPGGEVISVLLPSGQTLLHR